MHTEAYLCVCMCMCECMYILWHPFPPPFFLPKSQWVNLKSPLIKSWFVFGYLVSSFFKSHNALTLPFPLPLLVVSYFYFRWTTPLNPIATATLIRITERERHKQKLYGKEQTKGLTMKTDRPDSHPDLDKQNINNPIPLSPKVIQSLINCHL